MVVAEHFPKIFNYPPLTTVIWRARTNLSLKMLGGMFTMFGRHGVKLRLKERESGMDCAEAEQRLKRIEICVRMKQVEIIGNTKSCDPTIDCPGDCESAVSQKPVMGSSLYGIGFVYKAKDRKGQKRFFSIAKITLGSEPLKHFGQN
jgi:hypothetical protein